MATMVTDNGAKTPEQMAKDIVKAAVDNKLLEVSGTTFQKLETVVRYLNRDKIQGRSEAWFKKEFESLCSQTVELLISTREEQIVKYLAKKEQDEKSEAFRMLIARGLTVPDAYKAIYG